MDSLLIPELASKGPLVAVLVAMIIFFWRRDVRNDTKAERRHRACEDRNGALEKRVATLEDRQFKELKALAEDGVAGLRANTHALMRFLHAEDITPPDSFPAIPPKHAG